MITIEINEAWPTVKTEGKIRVDARCSWCKSPLETVDTEPSHNPVGADIIVTPCENCLDLVRDHERKKWETGEGSTS